jgi:uncharacterized protein
MPHDVILIGASVRAAAWSALRANLRPWCVDLFADADLERVACVRRVSASSYPRGLSAPLADAPNAPLMYTGGLENYPHVLAHLPRRLWGNGADVVRRVRSPFELARQFAAHGLPYPSVRAAPAPGRWLLKARRSAGGLGVRRWIGQDFNPRTHYLQQHLAGTPVSAVFVGRRDAHATLLGMTQQLIGTPWLHARGFAYAGTIGPIPTAPETNRTWQRIGELLAGEFALRGLFGVDAILHNEVPWPIEVNPRYTASIEVLERSLDIAALQLHRAAFEDIPVPASIRNQPGAPLTWGKAILFARKDVVFPPVGPWHGVTVDGDPWLADIPHPGEPIVTGHPVLTLFDTGQNASDCLVRLQESAQALDRTLHGQ